MSLTLPRLQLGHYGTTTAIMVSIMKYYKIFGKQKIAVAIRAPITHQEHIYEACVSVRTNMIQKFTIKY